MGTKFYPTVKERPCFIPAGQASQWPEMDKTGEYPCFIPAEAPVKKQTASPKAPAKKKPVKPKRPAVTTAAFIPEESSD